MKIGFIGAGKVGCSLGKYIQTYHACVAGYYSRSIEDARKAAEFTDSECFQTLQELIHSCDVVFLTVPDEQISNVYHQMRAVSNKSMVYVHCSGLQSSDIFYPMEGYALHPLLAVSSKWASYKALSDAVFTIEGEPLGHYEAIRNLFKDMGNSVVHITKEQKAKYHAAAAISSNLVTALVSISQKLLMECGFDEDEAVKALGPLVSNNVHNILEHGIVNSLTGAIERGDADTVQMHIKQLSGSEKKIYCQLSMQLVEIAKIKHPQRSYDRIKQLLSDEGSCQMCCQIKEREL